MLRCTLEAIFCQCKVDVVYIVNEFLNFVCYCAEHVASTDISGVVFDILYEHRVKLFQVSRTTSSILSLYAAGLYSKSDVIQDSLMENIGSSNDESAVTLLLPSGLYLQYLVVNPLRSLENYFGDSRHSRGLLNSADSEDGSSMGLKRKASRACKCKHGEASMFSYLNAFKFLCKQLVKYVDTTWEYMGSVTKFVTFSDEITYVWDALTQFCDMLTLSDTPEERARWHQYKETMLRAVVAALRIALGSGRDLEKPRKYIDHLISSGRIEPENLNTLVRIIYNTGATLANNKQMEQSASGVTSSLAMPMTVDKYQGAC